MKLRGTKDFYGDCEELFSKVEDISKRVFNSFKYSRVRFPLIENSNLFERVLSSSDVVNKELYSFRDRSDREISLVPEGTAPTARLVLENGLAPCKLFYISPFFRYDRPQKGRYRQFHQLGAELIGYSSIYSDLEILILFDQIMKSFSIEGKFKINFLGSQESRDRYTEYLRNSVSNRDVCSDCKRRIKQNVLRILDCKVDSFDDLKSIEEFLSDEDREKYNKICQMAKERGIVLEKSNIIRGLDYYTGIVFEYEYNGVVLGAGGRYDNLYSEIGKKALPSTGFAIGIERLLDNIVLVNKKKSSVRVIAVNDSCREKAFNLCIMLRKSGIETDFSLKKENIKSQLSKDGYKYALIIGQDEIENNEVTLRDMENSSQKRVSIEKIVEILNV